MCRNYIIASEQSIYFLFENIFKQLFLSNFPHMNNQSSEAWLQCKVKVVFYILQAAELLSAYVIQMSSCLKYLCTFVTAKKKQQVLSTAFDLVNLKFCSHLKWIFKSHQAHACAWACVWHEGSFSCLPYKQNAVIAKLLAMPFCQDLTVLTVGWQHSSIFSEQISGNLETYLKYFWIWQAIKSLGFVLWNKYG